MINKHQVGGKKLGECVSRFITVLSNVITDAYDIITDLSNVITDLSTFISKVFSWHPASFIIQWKWWIEFVFETGFRTVFRNGFRNKKRAHEWAPIWVQNFNISEPVLSRVCTENSQPFSHSWISVSNLWVTYALTRLWRLIVKNSWWKISSWLGYPQGDIL